MSDLLDRPARDLRQLVASRQVSAVEVVRATLARIDALNPALNAIVTLNPAALGDAAAIDRHLAGGGEAGPLCGVTVGIKDVTPVAALRTTFGSIEYRDYVPDDDALVVRRLRDAGAIIIGKTNCPEFAAGGNTFNDVFGRTRNPWDPTKSAGGSTGGGAAALAAGMIALAEGTDLGGSLRIPASFCGITGLRPSVGLVPTHPSDWAWDNLQVSGPMARNAGDVALMLQAIAGPSHYSPMRQPVGGRDFVAAALAGIPRGTRIAYCSDPARIGIDGEIETVCREAAMALRGETATVDEIDLDLSAARKAFLALRGLWFVTHMAPHIAKGARFGTNVSNNLKAGGEVSTADLAAAEQERNRVWHTFRRLFERYDYVLAPCMAVPPFSVEQNYPDTIAGRPMETYVDWIAPTFILSLSGLPVASVPCGLDGNRMPVGIQIIGRPSDEESVLALATVIERTRPIGLPNLDAIATRNIGS